MISDSIGDHLRPYRADFAAEATDAMQHFCIASTRLFAKYLQFII